MTANPRPAFKLPLLGSNQDSPDPETVARATKERAAKRDAAGMVQDGARNAPEVPTISHTVPSAFDFHDIAHLPLDEFLREQARRVQEWADATAARRPEKKERSKRARPRATTCFRCGGSDLSDARRGMRCNDCRAAKRKRSAAKGGKRSTWLKQYGLTAESYDAMFAAQNGVCAICKNAQTARRLAVDHCHGTGRVRGLLCTRCNAGLGQFKEDPGLFARALFYLEQHKEAVA